MDDATAEILGRAWGSDQPWRVLTRLSELEDRLAGHPSARKAASIVAAELEEAGVDDVHEVPFDMQRWEAGDAELAASVPGRDRSRSFEAIALPYCPAYEGTATETDVATSFPISVPDCDACPYWVRVRQVDGEIAWSSPVFVE